MSDATPLTQAGYVGEDVELVIHRLLQKCNYDVSLAETGIVFIDEIDKISRKIDSNSSSKDVSGEGVQQGLLRMLEGTVITINDKSAGVGAGLGGSGGIGSNIGGPGGDGILNISPGLVSNGNFFMGQPPKSDHLNSRHIPGIEKSDPSFDFLNSKGVTDGKTRQNNSKLNDQDLKRFDSLAEEDDSSVKKTSIPLNIPSSSKNGSGTNDFNNLFNAGNISRHRALSSVGKNSSAFNKPGVFSVDTSNILFILSGAFIGLENYVIDRVAKGSIGFNNPIRNKAQSSAASNLKSNKFDEIDQYSNIKQFFNPIQVGQNFKSEQNSPSSKFNPLDYVEPEDLIKFGLIPEFVGRLPVVASVSELSFEELTRILTEPKNSLFEQFHTLLGVNGVELVLTKNAIKAIALKAKEKKTGARGLRRIMENILLDPMFDCPDTDTKYVVVTSKSVDFIEKPKYFSADKYTSVVAELENDS
ncbi:ATP-dependent Clp protease ATP-binding subunit ClpX [Smittium culicis]|uniref:ATP-dependent Clp protease ATP-binding subunit ClpX n=1 Tax=Smittium culicis TaxID=133412 RepID=A0A1R1XPY9_9FUNG|nr:ATP-dependent Clp protease ATP-binding subunit ClpX [Smittium culicis]